MKQRRRWISLCASAVGIALVIAMKFQTRHPGAAVPAAGVGDLPTRRGAEEQMAGWLLHEGWLHLHHGQGRSAMAAAELVDFFRDGDGAAALRAALLWRIERAATALRQEREDAEAAGDALRARRARDLLMRLGKREVP